MGSSIVSSKELKYNAVYAAVLEILNYRSGLSGLNHSVLSRESGVTRSWIYKYVGKTKEEIIKRTSEHYVHELYRDRKLTPLSTIKELRKYIREDSLSFLKQAQKHPQLIPLIFIYYDSIGPIGEIVRESFKIYSNRLSSDIQKLLEISKTDAELISELISMTRVGLAFFLVGRNQSKTKSNRSTNYDINDLKRIYSQLKEIL